jgi:tRNA(His) guanylyltransferase
MDLPEDEVADIRQIGLGRSKADEKEGIFGGLALRMKQYEEAPISASGKIDVTQPFIVRVDGKKFSSFTQGLHKPFDDNMHVAMRNTALDLMEEFNPTTIQSHSDEISLIFVPHLNKHGSFPCEAPFGGRATKITTLVASFTAARLNYHLANHLVWTEYDTKSGISDKMKSGRAYFDGRIFNLPLDEVANYVIWRSVYDCRRNSIEGLARTLFDAKTLHGCNCGDMLNMMKEKGVLWESEPMAFRYGFFVKKEQYPVQSIHATSQNKEGLSQVMRKRSVIHNRIVHYNDSEWLLAKHLPQTPQYAPDNSQPRCARPDAECSENCVDVAPAKLVTVASKVYKRMWEPLPPLEWFPIKVEYQGEAEDGAATTWASSIEQEQEDEWLSKFKPQQRPAEAKPYKSD